MAGCRRTPPGDCVAAAKTLPVLKNHTMFRAGQRRLIVMITRRQFVMSTSMSTWAALALGAVGSFGGFEVFNGHGGRAEAQTFSVLELEAKGALDDIPMGSPTAPVTIIEYASMTCPHSAAFMLARCAGPDKYYPLIDTLFAQQQKWAVKEPLPPLRAIARQAGFTEQSFDACINDKALLAKVQQMRDRGTQKFKVEATPTFYINGEKHSGAMSIEDLDKAIAPLIKS